MDQYFCKIPRSITLQLLTFLPASAQQFALHLYKNNHLENFSIEKEVARLIFYQEFKKQYDVRRNFGCVFSEGLHLLKAQKNHAIICYKQNNLIKLLQKERKIIGRYCIARAFLVFFTTKLQKRHRERRSGPRRFVRACLSTSTRKTKRKLCLVRNANCAGSNSKMTKILKSTSLLMDTRSLKTLIKLVSSGCLVW
jgi:hypothetical protein